MNGNFGSIFAAIKNAWEADNYVLSAIPLWYGRADETDDVFPRATFMIADFDAPSYAFDRTKYIDEFIVQFNVWDSDIETVANLVENIHALYHRQKLTLDSGDFLCALRRGTQILVENKESPDSKTIYIGVSRFMFRVDNKD